MRKLDLISLVIIGVIAASCSKNLEGIVKDNFGNPVQDVLVKIENSNFETLTTEDGRYSLDYAAGSFKLQFSKENYVSTNIELNISEKRKYPIQDVQLIKYPDSSGVYFKDSANYVRLTEQAFPTTVTKDQMLFTTVRKTLYQFPDSSNYIKSDNSKIELYQFKDFGYQLIAPNKNGIIAVRESTAITPQVWITSDITKLDDNMYKRSIQVNSPTNLVLVQANTGSFLGFKIFRQMRSSGLCIRTE